MKIISSTGPTVEPMISDKREPKRKRQSGIYQILCKPTGKVYVGSAVWIAKRKRHHKEALLKGTHHSNHLQRAWDKYGAEAFEFFVLELCEKDKLVELEQTYIDLMMSADRKFGFNMQPKAHSNLGMVMSAEARAKISAARKGKPCSLSPSQIEELRERMKGNTFSVGLKHTPEARDKMKKAREGRKPALGMRHTEKARKKMSDTRRGRPLSETNKLGISRALKGKKKTAEHNWNAHVAQAKIKPNQFEKIKSEYIPGVVRMRDIAERYRCCTQTISNIINNKRMAHP